MSKRSFTEEGGWALTEAPQGSGHGPRLLEFKEHLNSARRNGLIWGGPAWSQDSTVLAGPFQLEILYDAIMLSFSNNCRRLYFV